jgi:hypothetical protein
MNKLRHLPWIIPLAFFSAIILLARMGRTLVDHRDGLVHLVAGFYFFLRENIPAISGDAATWIPGLGAFLLAMAIAHFFLRAWAAKRNRKWSLSTTAALGAVIPVLFATAFIVPGVILQVSTLRDVRWFEESPNMMRAQCRMELRTLAKEALSSAYSDPQERLPESLDIQSDQDHRQGYLFMLQRSRAGVPCEPVIYLGSGLTRHSDPSLPLFISTCYLKNGELIRTVATLGMDIFEIQDSETDAWIRRGLQRPAPEKP